MSEHNVGAQGGEGLHVKNRAQNDNDNNNSPVPGLSVPAYLYPVKPAPKNPCGLATPEVHACPPKCLGQMSVGRVRQPNLPVNPPPHDLIWLV